MRAYDPNTTVPETYEVVDDMATRLEGDTDLTDLLLSAGSVERHAWPPPPDVNDPWARILVREPVNPVPAMTPVLSRWAPYEVVVGVSDHADDAWNPHLTASAVHTRVQELLVGYTPSLSHATAHLPIERGSFPGRLKWMQGQQQFESRAVYRITLLPT